MRHRIRESPVRSERLSIFVIRTEFVIRHKPDSIDFGIELPVAFAVNRKYRTYQFPERPNSTPVFIAGEQRRSRKKKHGTRRFGSEFFCRRPDVRSGETGKQAPLRCQG